LRYVTEQEINRILLDIEVNCIKQIKNKNINTHVKKRYLNQFYTVREIKKQIKLLLDEKYK
tara:strand:- start:741 stop:923 length:183 start_codon:yes stop_codon:yes gene_type:complete